MSNGKTTQSRSITDLFLGEEVRRASAESIRDLPVDSIQPNPYQVRKEFPEESIRELAESIKQNGLLQPILVRRAASAAGEKYELIVGERRWRAVKLLGLQTIKAVIRDCPDKKMRLQALLENIQRLDLSVLEKAQAFKGLILELKTVGAVASWLGVSDRTVQRYLRIAELPESEQKVIATEGISIRKSLQAVKKGRGDIVSPPSPKPRFWQIVKEVEVRINKPTNKLTDRLVDKREQQALAKRAWDFFKRIGAKKFEVKF